MMEWWYSLPSISPSLPYFYLGALFFSVIFGWQLIMSLIGIGHDMADDVTSHVDMGVDHTQLDPTANVDAHESLLAFKLLSIRSILAFFTLFFWATALYLNSGNTAAMSLLYGVLWGVAAMVLVALIFHLMQKLTQTGTMQMTSCIGATGTVYLDLPTGGQGEVRVLVSGVMVHVRAKAVGGEALLAGTKVRVVRIIDPTTIEVSKERM